MLTTSNYPFLGINNIPVRLAKYSELPDLSNYYTKEEVDDLIQSTSIIKEATTEREYDVASAASGYGAVMARSDIFSDTNIHVLSAEVTFLGIMITNSVKLQGVTNAYLNVSIYGQNSVNIVYDYKHGEYYMIDGINTTITINGDTLLASITAGGKKNGSNYNARVEGIVKFHFKYKYMDI